MLLLCIAACKVPLELECLPLLRGCKPTALRKPPPHPKGMMALTICGSQVRGWNSTELMLLRGLDAMCCSTLAPLAVLSSCSSVVSL